MSASKQNRIDILDGWRTLAVLFMVVWHALYDLAAVGAIPAAWMQSTASELVRSFVSVSFILLAGISCRFTRSNLRRGVKTLLAAMLVTAATWAAGQPVWFGVLHLLGCGMLLYALVGKRWERLPDGAAIGTGLILFAVTRLVTERVRVGVPGLWILGLRTAGFSSADYYPLLPWLPLFFAGAALGGMILKSDGAWKGKKLPAWATWPGRHALIIYLVHQPILWGVARWLAG